MKQSNSYYFAASMNRLTLLSPGKSMIEIDRLVFAHIGAQSPKTILGVAQVFMGNINHPDFGQNIKRIMAGGMIERLKLEASNLANVNRNSA